MNCKGVPRLMHAPAMRRSCSRRPTSARTRRRSCSSSGAPSRATPCSSALPTWQRSCKWVPVLRDHLLGAAPPVAHAQHVATFWYIDVSPDRPVVQVALPISYFERSNNAFFNSLAVFDADGSCAGRYRKSHIPDGIGCAEGRPLLQGAHAAPAKCACWRPCHATSFNDD